MSTRPCQCQHGLVDVMVTTCGAIEEDLMKVIRPHYLGKFNLKGKELRLKGQNRIGNLIVPNENYCKFEDWLTPILKTMHEEQEMDGIKIRSPSRKGSTLTTTNNDEISFNFNFAISPYTSSTRTSYNIKKHKT